MTFDFWIFNFPPKSFGEVPQIKNFFAIFYNMLRNNQHTKRFFPIIKIGWNILFFQKVYNFWYPCKAQGFTTMSSSEAGYCVLSSAAQEMTFVHEFIKELGLYTLPDIIFEDNMGASYFIHKWLYNSKAKYIDK